MVADGLLHREKRRAHRFGYLASDMRAFGWTDDDVRPHLSERDYLSLYPFNGPYDKWIRDRISAMMVFHDFADLFALCHFQIIRRDCEAFIIPLSPQAQRLTPSLKGLHALLESEGAMTITSCAWSDRARWRVSALPVEDGAAFGAAPVFLLDGEPVSAAQMKDWLERASRRWTLAIIDDRFEVSSFASIAPNARISLGIRMIRDSDGPAIGQAFICLEYRYVESFDTGAESLTLEKDAGDADEPDFEDGIPCRLKRYAARRLYAPVDTLAGTYCGLKTRVGDEVIDFARAPFSDRAFQGTVPHWDKIADTLIALCRTIPQIGYAQFDLAVSEIGFRIEGISAAPSFAEALPLSPAIDAFLSQRAQAKRTAFKRPAARMKRFAHNLKLKVRRMWAQSVALEGLVPYQSTRWLRDMWQDLRIPNGMTLREKHRAHSWGFLSYRIDQYGITADNRGAYISDFEYRWLRHINCKYRYWLEDKVTLKFIAKDYATCFPAYYYYTESEGDSSRIIAMMDAPAGYEAGLEGILHLVREQGDVALKPDEGSHGEGFYRLSWNPEGVGGYLLNSTPATEEDIRRLLGDPSNRYLVTEYIRMHPTLAALYPDSVNTIRIIVFKRDGRTPQIGNAYMRIGTSATGGVDNVAAGGIVASVDVETGAFGNARMLSGVDRGTLVPCSIHPDTGAPIEGTVPNWEYAKTTVLGIAAELPQLEYLGFDVAITADGVKLPEINRFPDFPRVEQLSPQAIEYLQYKLACKKHQYGYDTKPCRKPLHLPRIEGRRA